MQSQRIGAILAQRGVLTADQVQQVLSRQRGDDRPFGPLAEMLFKVPLNVIASALAEQILASCPHTGLVGETLDDNCLTILRPRDAWEALVLPMRIEAGTVVCATTQETLPNAIELIQRSVPLPFRFAIADIRLLEQFIAERYHYEGVEV